MRARARESSMLREFCVERAVWEASFKMHANVFKWVLYIQSVANTRLLTLHASNSFRSALHTFTPSISPALVLKLWELAIIASTKVWRHSNTRFLSLGVKFLLKIDNGHSKDVGVYISICRGHGKPLFACFFLNSSSSPLARSQGVTYTKCFSLSLSALQNTSIHIYINIYIYLFIYIDIWI